MSSPCVSVQEASEAPDKQGEPRNNEDQETASRSREEIQDEEPPEKETPDNSSKPREFGSDEQSHLCTLHVCLSHFLRCERFPDNYLVINERHQKRPPKKTWTSTKPKRPNRPTLLTGFNEHLEETSMTVWKVTLIRLLRRYHAAPIAM